MNTTSLLFNSSYINESLTSGIPSFGNPCIENGAINLDCVFTDICSQLDTWLWNTGIGVMLFYVIATHGSRFFLNRGWKWLPEKSLVREYFSSYENRLYWFIFVKDRVLLVMFCFIGLVLYNYWKGF